MSDVRLSGSEEDGAAQLLASARARLCAAAADLALGDAHRLTEWQRATVSALLAGLVRAIEDELRSALAGRFEAPAYEGLRAALSSAQLPIALRVLQTGSSLFDPALLAVLLRRAEEHRLAAADHVLLGALAGDGDEAVAEEAMSLLVLQGSRLDPFQGPLIGRGELPAEVQHRLVWTIAAALRRYMVAHHRVDPATADEALSACAEALLAQYDEGAGVEAGSLRLVHRLSALGRLDDGFVTRALSEGTLPLFIAALGVRAGLASPAAAEILTDSAGRGAPLLLRAAGIARPAAAAILLQMQPSETALAAQLDAYDGATPEQAARLLAPWRADAAYRSAIASLAA
jgi:hypothetical protein